MDTPTWKNTLNTEFAADGQESPYVHINVALATAQRARYPFLAWQGQVFRVEGTKALKTSVTTADLDAQLNE